MTAALLPNGKQQFEDINGDPLVGGLVYFYIPNSLVPKNTWHDQAQSILNTNPVVLDSRGQAIIYGSGGYRQILKDATGNTIWDQLTTTDTSSSGIGGLYVNSSTYATLALADAAAVAAGYGLNIDKNWTLAANTVLAARDVLFSGGKITRSTYLFSCAAASGSEYAWFDAAGTGFIWLGNTPTLHFTWFGAVGNRSTDDSNAWNQALKTAVGNKPSPLIAATYTTHIAGGSSYTNGTYAAVPLTGGYGTGAIATITVAGGAVTQVQVTTVGANYCLGDVLSASAANIGGTGSGFTFTVYIFSQNNTSTGVTLVATPSRYYKFSSQVAGTFPTVVQAPYYRKVVISGYGATVEPAAGAAISTLDLTGGYVGGWSVLGLTFYNYNNTSVLYGIRGLGAVSAVVRDCIFATGDNSATYAPIYFNATDVTDKDTGSFWVTLDNNWLRIVTGSYASYGQYGILLKGQQNAARILNNKFTGYVNGVYFVENVGGGAAVGLSNSVLIEGNAFEGISSSCVTCVGTAGGYACGGLVITNNRYEAIENSPGANNGYLLSMTGATLWQNGLTPYISSNQNVAFLTAPVNNPNSIPYTLIGPESNLGLINNYGGYTIQSQDSTTDVLTLWQGNTGSGLGFKTLSGGLAGWLRYARSGWMELAGIVGSSVMLSLVGVNALSATATPAKNLRGSGTFAGAATKAITFANGSEADAAYFVSVSGSVNETFWVTSKAVGGFTLNSSNATSTATVDWHLIR